MVPRRRARTSSSSHHAKHAGPGPHGTVDDVARLAGVGKGTVYLYSPSERELFGSVPTRESARTLVKADLAEVRLHRSIRWSFLQIIRRPLSRAFAARDYDVQGELMTASEARAQFAAGKIGMTARYLAQGALGFRTRGRAAAADAAGCGKRTHRSARAAGGGTGRCAARRRHPRVTISEIQRGRCQGAGQGSVYGRYGNLADHAVRAGRGRPGRADESR